MIGIDFNQGAFFWCYSTDINQGDTSSPNWKVKKARSEITIASTFNFAYQINIAIDSSDGSVTGTWSDTDSADSGTLIGTKIISSDYVDQYVGNYKGKYVGDASDDIVIRIKSNGDINGDITESVTIDGDDYPFNAFG